MNNNQPIPKISTDERFVNGISDFLKEGQPDTYANGVAIDHRSDPRGIELLPRSVKESGSTVTDLVKWMTTYPSNLTTFMYGDTGNFYSRTTTPTYTLISQIPNSNGNGLFYYPEDDYVYLTGDSTLNRYGPITNGSPQLTLNFLQALGGVPTNTNSLSLVAASSQYADHADASGFDITSDISLACWINPNSLPTVGNTMALIAKWKESGNLRSYKLAIGAISGTFGSGTDGSLTISSNTTEAPIDSACTGTAGTQSLSATNTSFVAGQQVLIHQSQGTSAGQYERNSIQSYTAGTITLVNNLIGTYTTGAQVRVLNQYANVTINTGVTYTAKAWNGSTGGILAFLANGTVTINGTISARGVDGVLSTAAGSTGGGFAGGLGIFNNTITYEQGGQGDGSTGAGGFSTSANGTGGGGGLRINGSARAGGGGGGYGTAGTTGTGSDNEGGSYTAGTGGGTGGALDLSNLQFGGGGGGAVNQGDHAYSSSASGGGAVFIEAVTFVNSGTIIADGGSVPNAESTGGAGAGGSILIKAQTATMGNMTANGGIQTPGGYSGQGVGGNAGDGLINLDYLTSFTQGTITPTLNTIQDSTLVTSVTYQLQFSVSNDGTAAETLFQTVPIQTGQWQHVAVSWAAASSTATFYLNAVSQGMAVGTKTSIANEAAAFYVGTYFGASAVQSFYDGLIDDVMVFNAQQGASFWTTVLSQQIASNTPNLVTFYKCNGSLNDATANAYNLTGVNTPTYSTSVPYPGATTRLDIDLTQTGTGQTYTTPTAIIEDATDEIAFTPQHDPQKSIQVGVAAVGTGDWTVTVHDAQNNLITSVTYLNATVNTGAFEFVFPTPWRVLTNFTNTYHVHFTTTTGDGTITTGTSANLSTAGYTTYFSFLVTDTAYHPIGQMLNQMVIGNERYIGTYNGLPASYNPNTLILPAAWHVRCFAYWNEYLCIGVVRGNSITDFDMGRVYFWDGSALTFNFYIDIEGGVNAMQGYRGNLYIWVGYQGYLYEYTSGALNAEKAKRQPLIQEGDTMEIFPDATIMWKTLLRYGSAGSSTSTTINRGLYTYGSFLTLGFFTQMYRDSLSFDYVASTGNYGSTISIGSVNTVQNEILMSWRDGIACGVDNISTNNLPASYGTIELLVQDDGRVDKNKTALTMLIQHNPLRTGETMQPKYNLDRGSWVLGAINSTVGSMKSPIVIPEQRYQEYQVGAIFGSTSSTSPKITGISFERDPRINEIKLQTD